MDSEGSSPISDLPLDILEARILPLLSMRDKYTLSRVAKRYQGLFTPFERARMAQEVFMQQRYRDYFNRVGNDAFQYDIDLSNATMKQDKRPRNIAVNSHVRSALDGIRFVAVDADDLTPDQRRAKVQSLMNGLGLDDILSTDAAFMSKQPNLGIITRAVEKLENHYGSRWTAEFIAELRERNPLYWSLLSGLSDPEDTETVIEKTEYAKGIQSHNVDDSWRPPKMARRARGDWATERDWSRFRDRAWEYPFVKERLLPPGPDRPFVFTSLSPFMDHRFRARFSYDLPGLIMSHPSYTQVAPGSGMTPPTFKLLKGHASPW